MHKLHLIPDTFLKKYSILHIVCGEVRGRVSRKPLYSGMKSAKLIKQCCTRGHGISRASETRHTSALGPITPVSSREKANFPETKTLTPSGAWP